MVTSRLHCHLPLRSIGVETIRAVNPADVRFNGLIDITDQEFEAIRSGLTEKLERIIRPMIAGEPEADVYAAWREATADDVAAAERELRRDVALQAPAAKWAARVPRVVGATKTYSARPRTANARGLRRVPPQPPRPRRRRVARLAGRARVQAGSPVGARRRRTAPSTGSRRPSRR